MQDLEFEQSYWGDCTNTFDEDQKHFTYASCMGLRQTHYTINIPPIRVLDVGGGPTSMLLKTDQLVEGKVWDPIVYPAWTIDRYLTRNISVCHQYGEYLTETGWDEVWLYNCLHHVQDPGLIIENCLRAGKVVRVFEWVDVAPHAGHPQLLTKALLDKWLRSNGQVVRLHNQRGCTGLAYSAVVSTEKTS